ncbi:MAG: hypothetical protein RJB03_1710 [Bacteroidota bacterium]|jgi:hypothetical protein
MELYKIFIGLHIAGGSAGLLSGIFVLLTQKGNTRHKLLGNFFHWGMNIAGLTSLALSQMRPNSFLFLVGVFTLYMNYTGKKYLSYQNKASKPEWLDHAVSLTMLSVAILFIWKGNILLKSDSFGWVYVAYGFISLFMTLGDFRFALQKEPPAFAWLQYHLQRMIGTFIAAATAFLVVNVNMKPAYLIWLAPTAILTPLIIFWSQQYKNKRP